MMPSVAIVYAHRGGAKLRPENTLLAFDHGLSLGADGLEFDVHLSRDGVVVVHHDATLDPNGHGPRRAHCGRARASRRGAHFTDSPRTSSTRARHLEHPRHPAHPAHPTHPTHPAQHPFRGLAGGVPTLHEVLRRYPSIPLIIELKVNEPELARRTIDVIRAADAVDRVALGSFGTRVLRAARAYEPAIRTGSSREETRLALYRSWVRWPVRHPRYQEYQVPEVSGTTRVVSPRFVRYAHEAGLPVKVWTVDEAGDIRRLLSWGVDAIITDRPDIGVAAFGANIPWSIGVNVMEGGMPNFTSSLCPWLVPSSGVLPLRASDRVAVYARVDHWSWRPTTTRRARFSLRRVSVAKRQSQRLSRPPAGLCSSPRRRALIRRGWAV